MPRRPSGQASTMPATSAPAGEPGPLTEAGGTATPMRGRFRPPPRGDARSKQEATRLPAQAGIRADGRGRGCARLVAVASRALRPSAVDGGRFHSPLRGSSGMAGLAGALHQIPV